MQIIVLVPTYKRSADLQKCLEALEVQARIPDQVLLVVREDDEATLHMVREWRNRLSLRIEQTTIPGQVNALNAGLAVADGDIVAITDDDAAPRSDWLQRIEQHFQSDPEIGGVGGRDWVHEGAHVIGGSASLVGRIQWFGRIVGNHHLGIGPPRYVDFLKGANMSYRRSALQGLTFDVHLRGLGAQVCNDLAFSLGVRRNGWKLMYDPAVAVDHYPAQRFDIDKRGEFHAQAVEDNSFNQYWALSTYLTDGMTRNIACAWQLLVGSRSLPGYLHLLLGLARRDRDVWRRWKAAHRGRRIARRI